jgi:ubiquinol-cytochrome c reductase subunit 9
MAITGAFYRTVGRRFSTVLLFSVCGAIALDAYVNRLTEYIWDYHNYGKQWKDIKHKYAIEKADEE